MCVCELCVYVCCIYVYRCMCSCVEVTSQYQVSSSITDSPYLSLELTDSARLVTSGNYMSLPQKS